MGRKLAVLCVLMLLCGVVVGADEVRQPPTVTREFEVRPLFGKTTVTMYPPSTRGRGPSILHFWATWCGPCREEIPGLMEFSRKNPEVMIAAVAIADDRDEVTRFLVVAGRKMKEDWFTLKVFWSLAETDTESELGQYYITQGIPTTMFVNRDGTIAAYHVGNIDWKSKRVGRAVKAFREGKPFTIE